MALHPDVETSYRFDHDRDATYVYAKRVLRGGNREMDARVATRIPGHLDTDKAIQVADTLATAMENDSFASGYVVRELEECCVVPYEEVVEAAQ